MKKKTIIITSLLLVLALFFGGLFIFWFQKGRDVPEESTGEKEEKPLFEKGKYENRDFSKRFIKSTAVEEKWVQGGYILYGKSIYFMDDYLSIKKYYIGDLTGEVENSVVYREILNFNEKGKSEFLCTDPNCSHRTSGCPCNVGALKGEWLIDSYESAGDHPILYFAGPVDEDFDDSGHLTSKDLAISRYDSGTNERKVILKEKGYIRNFAVYDDYLFCTKSDFDNNSEVVVINKKGKVLCRWAAGKGVIFMINFENGCLYFEDTLGNLYEGNMENKTVQKIWKWKGTAIPKKIFYEDLKIHKGYLYYYDGVDERDPYQVGKDKFHLYTLKKTLYRLPLNNLNGKPEKLVEKVYEESNFDFYNDELYYMKFDPADVHAYKCVANKTKGNIYKLNLNTLENTLVRGDCGMNIISARYCTDRFCIADMANYREEYGITTSGIYVYLYDFETGKAYRLNCSRSEHSSELQSEIDMFENAMITMKTASKEEVEAWKKDFAKLKAKLDEKAKPVD